MVAVRSFGALILAVVAQSALCSIASGISLTLGAFRLLNASQAWPSRGACVRQESDCLDEPLLLSFTFLLVTQVVSKGDRGTQVPLPRHRHKQEKPKEAGRDFYKILNIPRNANKDQIKQASRG